MPSSPISRCTSCPPHAAGGHGCAVSSSSVTEAQWAILEPLLPAPGSTQAAADDPRSIASDGWPSVRGCLPAGVDRTRTRPVGGRRPINPQRDCSPQQYRSGSRPHF